MKKYFLTLAVLFISGYFASQIQSSFGNVRVQSIKIPTQNGQWLVADLFKPYSATANNPSPLVIVVPGFQRSKETLSNIAIELSRRGIVTISIDPYAQGLSSSSFSTRAATKEGYGMFSLVDYVYDTSILNYIDKDKIGVTGHSAGGLAAIRSAQHFGKIARKKNTKSKVHSVFVSGMLRMGFKEKDLKKIRSNVGVSYALYDEGAWQNELKNGNLENAPEILRLINLQNNGENNIRRVEMGKYYGSIDNNSATIIFNEKLLHPFQPYSKQAISNQINYFLKVFEMNDVMRGDNQIWFWKESLTFICLVCGLILIIPTSKFFLDLSFFKELKKPIPKSIPVPKGRGLILFWGIISISILIACFSFVPLSELTKSLFIDAANRKQTWFFPQRMNNAIMLWAALNGIVGLIIFYLSYTIYGKKNGVKKNMLGVSISRVQMLKTIVLAFLIACSYFILLSVVYYLFHIDYRFIFISAKVFSKETLYALPMYLPFFFIFFLSNSIRINGSLRFQSSIGPPNSVLSVLGTSGGLIAILLIQYIYFWLTGTVFWKEGWLYVNLLFAVVPILLILPLFQQFFFKITGRVYLGPLTMSLVFVIMLLSNSVYYYPL